MKKRTIINQLRAWLCLVLALSAWSTASADIWVAQQKISGTEDVTFRQGGCFTKGFISYSAKNNKLTLTNATIDMSEAELDTEDPNMNIPICTDTKGLMVKIEGDCVIKGKNSWAILINGSFLLKGDSYESSWLTIESVDGIFSPNSIIIADLKVDITTTSKAWNHYPVRVPSSAEKGDLGNLRFLNTIATLTRPAEVEDPGKLSDGLPRAIGDITKGRIYLTGCDFLDAVWEEGSDVCQVVDGKATDTPAYTVHIGRWQEKELVQIGGVDITPDNYKKITGGGIKSGYATYRYATKTLTLNNAVVEGTIATGPYRAYTEKWPEFNLELVGKNKVVGIYKLYCDFVQQVINVRPSPSATARPSLTMSGYSDSESKYFTLRHEGKNTLNISSIDLTFGKASTPFWLDTENGTELEVNINDCNIDAPGPGGASTLDFSNIDFNLSACAFVGGKWNASNHTYSEHSMTIRKQPQNPLYVNKIPLQDGDKVEYSSTQYMEYKDNVLTLRNMKENPIGDIEYFGVNDLTIQIFDLKTYNSQGEQTPQTINSITSLNANVAIKNMLPFVNASEDVINQYGTDFPNLRLNIGTDPKTSSVKMSAEKTLRIVDFTTQLTFIGSVGVGNIDIQNSNVDFTAESSPVKGVNSVTTSGCTLKTIGAELKGGYFYDSDDNRLASVSYGKVKGYPIWVNGIGITVENKDNITGPGIEGKVSYDPATHTLTLENARITEGNVNTYGGLLFIHKTIDDFTIQLKGTNTLTGIESAGILWYAISGNKNLTITGNGTLNMKVGDKYFYGISIYSHEYGADFTGTVNINGGAKVDITAPLGISFLGTKSQSYVNVNDAMLHVVNGSDSRDFYGPIYGDYTLTTNCDIMESGVSVTDGKILGFADEVTLTRSYGISVGGVKVHPGNASMVTGENIKGYVSYDADTHTLTLNNATITGAKWSETVEAASKQGIAVDYDADVKRLNIKLVGANYITSGDAANTNQGNGIYANRLLSLEGTGSLTIDNFARGIVVMTHAYEEVLQDYVPYFSPLTVTDCSLFLNTPEGIDWNAASIDENNKISFKNAYVEAPGTNNFFSEQRYEGCSMISGEPRDSSDPYNVWGVIISSPGLWVKGIKVTDENADDVLGNGTTDANGNAVVPVKYDAANNILYLNNVWMALSERSGQAAGILYVQNPEEYSNFSIRLKGNNYIQNDGGAPIKLVASSVMIEALDEEYIETGGGLTLRGKTGSFFSQNAQIEATFHATSYQGAAVKAGNEINATKSFWAACLDSENTEPVVDAPNFSVGELTLLVPEGGEYGYDEETGQWQYLNADGTLITSQIYFADDNRYGISVGGVMVSRLNASNVISDAIESGTVSYDYEENTLYLDNVVFKEDAFITCINAIEIDQTNQSNQEFSKPLTIALTGASHLKASNSGIEIVTGSPVTIKSQDADSRGSLSILSGSMGVHMRDALTLDDIVLNIQAYNHGISSFNPANMLDDVKLSISEDAVLHITPLYDNEDFQGISRMGQITYAENTLVIPENGFVSSDGGSNTISYEENGTNIAREVKFISFNNFGVYVKGKAIGQSNADDVLGDGKVTFDYQTNTLTLNEAEIKVDPWGVGIDNNSGMPLTIEVKGENKILLSPKGQSEGSHWGHGCGIQSLTGDIIIKGSNNTTDKLYVSSLKASGMESNACRPGNSGAYHPGWGGTGIVTNGSFNISASDCFLNVGTVYGIGECDTLSFSNSYVYVSGRGDQNSTDDQGPQPIYKFNHLQMSHDNIQFPYQGFAGGPEDFRRILDAKGGYALNDNGSNSYDEFFCRRVDIEPYDLYGIRVFGREFGNSATYFDFADASSGSSFGRVYQEGNGYDMTIVFDGLTAEADFSDNVPALEVYNIKEGLPYLTGPLKVKIVGENRIHLNSDKLFVISNGAEVKLISDDDNSKLIVEGERATGIYMAGESTLRIEGTAYANSEGIDVAFDGDAPGNTLIVDASTATFLSERMTTATALASNPNIDLYIRDAFVNATNATSLTVGGEELITTTTQGKRMVRRKVAGAGDDGDGLLVRGENASYIEILPGHAAPETPYITFADYEVEKVCLAQFDTNGDGVVSMREAALATNTDFLGLFDENATAIETFDELQYFTGLTAIPGELFSGCTSLKSVQIPPSVTAIGAFAFQGCDALEQITIPAGVTTIGQQALDAKSLKTVYMNAATVPDLNKVFGEEQLAAADFRVLVDYQVHKTYRDNAANWEAVKTKLFPYKSVIDEGNAGDPCDINRDGKVTIADVTKLVNKILGKE